MSPRTSASLFDLKGSSMNSEIDSDFSRNSSTDMTQEDSKVLPYNKAFAKTDGAALMAAAFKKEQVSKMSPLKEEVMPK